MKFKLFGLGWDFSIVLSILFALWCGFSILGLFILKSPDVSAWYILVYVVSTVINLATAESISDRLL